MYKTDSYRRNFDLNKKNEIHYHSWKEHLKMSKIAKFGCCKMRKIYNPVKFANFVYIFILRSVKIPLSVEKWLFFPILYIFFLWAIFSSFYNNSQPNVAILIILRCSFQFVLLV